MRRPEERIEIEKSIATLVGAEIAAANLDGWGFVVLTLRDGRRVEFSADDMGDVSVEIS